MNKNVVVTGASLIVLAIVLGAFGAHALKSALSMEQLISFETGVRYQMYHGITLLIIGLSIERIPFKTKVFTGLIVAGIVLFSGSIYLLSLKTVIGLDLKFLGPVTPIGGVLLIIGWSLFIVKLLRAKSN